MRSYESGLETLDSAAIIRDLPNHTTPRKIGQRLLNWCSNISGAVPIFLDSGQGKAMFCYLNCLSHYARNGGSILPGWIIWEGKISMQAEPHSVMVGDDGDLFDVTATVDGEKQVLFLPDLRNELPRINGMCIENYGNLVFPITKPKKRQVRFWNQNIVVTVAGTPKFSDAEKAFLEAFTLLITQQ